MRITTVNVKGTQFKPELNLEHNENHYLFTTIVIIEANNIIGDIGHYIVLLKLLFKKEQSVT